MLLPNGTIIATSSPFDANLYESEYSVTDENLQKLLSENVKLLQEVGSGESKKKKKKNKSKGGSNAAAPTADNKENKESGDVAKEAAPAEKA